MPNVNTFAPSGISLDRSEPLPSLSRGSKVVVIGAGAFGGWSALYLQRAGFNVILVDAWGPGNSRSSSGDETRVIRSTYGANNFYFDLNVRALELWKENEKGFNRNLFFNSGVLWFCYEEKTPIVDDAIPFAQKHQMEYEYLSLKDLTQRYPLIHTADLHHAYLDPFGGYLKARESCQAVADAFYREGGKLIQALVHPGKIESGSIREIRLSTGEKLTADLYLFACGSWLGQIFPEALGNVIHCTKQEVFYLGVPSANSARYESFPVWVDVDGSDFYYGIPGNAHRGFKIGVDRRGTTFDPTSGDRTSNPEVMTKAREFIGHRFPELKDAPVLESRVCPYENSPDGNFIFDVHPEASNVLFLGGGSGHGFKHGPALGEMIAEIIKGASPTPGLFRLGKG